MARSTMGTPSTGQSSLFPPNRRPDPEAISTAPAFTARSPTVPGGQTAPARS